MGNWFGRNKLAVYPLECPHRTSSNSFKVKVRMTKAQLKELMTQVDMNKQNSNQHLGQLILKDCLQGRFTARIIASVDHDRLGSKFSHSLSTIFEDEREAF